MGYNHMKLRTVAMYALVGVTVLILGALAGWYFFISTQTKTTVAEDTARGYISAPLAGKGSDAGGATSVAGTLPKSPAAGKGVFSRIWDTITRRDTGVSDPSTFASFNQDQAGFTTDASQATDLPAKLSGERPPRLWHVEKKPVAGMAFVKNGSSEYLRYVDRGSGNVFEADPKTGDTTRLTNTLISRVYEATVTGSGRVIGRSIDEIGVVTTFIGSVATSSEATSSARSLLTADLPKNIAYIVADPKTDALFYLTSEAGTAVGIRSEWNGAKPKRMFGSPIMHWRPWWLADGRIVLVQAAADSVPGYAYELTGDGSLVPLLRAIPGLTLLPRASGAMLYGRSDSGTLALFAQINATTTATRLPIKTIADKCAWSTGRDPVAYCGVPQGFAAQNFLDDWYRGMVHSSDAIWLVDARAGSAEVLYTPDSSLSLDIARPAVDSTGGYIAFINAADQSLWILRTKD